MSEFNVKDHGVREEMKTGSVRDTQKGKPRFDLVPATCLTKLALHYGAGSEKYGDRNWEKGQSITRYMSSAERHFQYFKMGLTDENHLMACVWNLFCIDWTLDQIAAGKLPEELDDRTPEMLGGKICTDLFAKIEENIKSKLEKCSKTDTVNKEKCSTGDKIIDKILFEKNKNPENVKNVTKKNLENVIKDINEAFSSVRKVIPIETDVEDTFVTITANDDSFICVMLSNGKFMNYEENRGIRYSRMNIDFFDSKYNCKASVAVEEEIRRLNKEGIKYAVISEDVYDAVNCEGKEGLLYGYNAEKKQLEFIKTVKEIKQLDLDKDVMDKYKMFTIGVMK